MVFALARAGEEIFLFLYFSFIGSYKCVDMNGRSAKWTMDEKSVHTYIIRGKNCKKALKRSSSVDLKGKLFLTFYSYLLLIIYICAVAHISPLFLKGIVFWSF